MQVLLTAFGAKHIHKTLAPWYLKAYCDIHVPACDIVVQEHNINDAPGDIVSQIYLGKPDVVGFSCYIWNVELVVKIAAMLKQVLPNCVIILGGPEVSFEADCGAYPFANYIVQGAGEMTFAKVLREILDGNVSHGQIRGAGEGMDFAELPSPYTAAYYDSFREGRMGAMEHQLVYYESSRGCPFSCAYCLSSADCGVMELPLERVFSEIGGLLAQGARCIKFVDRTFNANQWRAVEIFRHILSLDTDCTFHFEVAADLFHPEMLEVVSLMPRQRVQFEIGIQSTNGETLAEIHRGMNLALALENIKTLVGFGNCHVHVDLIAGLPFETVDSFGRGIDQCMAVRPHMLQLGFLKLLKGTGIRENSAAYGYVWNPFPPYQVFRSDSMDFADMIQLRDIERVINKFYNSGMFANAIEYAIHSVFGSGYACFSKLSDFCRGMHLQVSLKEVYTILLDFLCAHTDKAAAEHVIKLDCLTFDTKGMLPEGIIPRRDKQAEGEWKRDSLFNYRHVRVEHFDFDKKTRVFIYDEKDVIKKSHRVIEGDSL